MMKGKKFLVLALVLSMFMMIFSGCTKQEQSLAEVIKNAQDMKSYEGKSDLKFNLSLVSGGTADEKKMMIQVAPMVNGINIGMDTKVINKGDAMKAYAKMNISNPVMPIGCEVWADMDKSGNGKEFIKSKEFFDFMSSTDPAAGKIFSGKEYFTIDTNEMMNAPELKKSGMDMKKFQEVLGNYTKGIEDISKKMADIKIQTGDAGIVNDKGEQTVKVNGEDVKAQLYEVKLTDSDFKKLLVLNKDFSKNNEALVKECQKVFTDYMFGVMDASASSKNDKGQPSKEEIKKEMEKGFAEMSKSTAKFMEVLKNTGDIKILGDKGISINYYVKDGNIVKSNSKVEFLIDMPKLMKLSQNMDTAFTGNKSEVKSDLATGVYSFLIESNSDIYNINKIDDIKMPEINSKNSISVMEFSKQMESAMEVQKKATTTKPVVKPAKIIKPAVKSLNITVSKKVVLKNGYVSVDTLKSVKGSVVNSKGVIKLSVNGKVVTGKLNTASFITSNNKIYVSIKVLKNMGINIIVK